MRQFSKAIQELESVERELEGQLTAVREAMRVLRADSVLPPSLRIPASGRRGRPKLTSSALRPVGTTGKKRGRPKGRKLSEETRAKMRAAWALRKAAKNSATTES